MHRLLAAICLGAILPSVAIGQSQVVRDRSEVRKSELSHFRLFNSCDRMLLVVEVDAADMGLTGLRVGAAAESRLRAARLRIVAGTDEYSVDNFLDNVDSGDPVVLYIGVSASRSMYNARVDYSRRVTTVAGHTNFASTWSRDWAQVHGGDSGDFMSDLSGILDEFIAGYLRVNESACHTPSEQ